MKKIKKILDTLGIPRETPKGSSYNPDADLDQTPNLIAIPGQTGGYPTPLHLLITMNIPAFTNQKIFETNRSYA